MPKYKFKVEDTKGNLLREGTGLFMDRKHAKDTLLEREGRRNGEQGNSVTVTEVKG